MPTPRPSNPYIYRHGCDPPNRALAVSAPTVAQFQFFKSSNTTYYPGSHNHLFFIAAASRRESESTHCGQIGLLPDHHLNTRLATIGAHGLVHTIPYKFLDFRVPGMHRRDADISLGIMVLSQSALRKMEEGS